jgi:hypothetical protein
MKSKQLFKKAVPKRKKQDLENPARTNNSEKKIIETHVTITIYIINFSLSKIQTIESSSINIR